MATAHSVVVVAAVVVAFSSQFAFSSTMACCEGKNSWEHVAEFANARDTMRKLGVGLRYLGLQKGTTLGIPRVRTPIGLNAEAQMQKIDMRSQRGS